MASIFSSMLGRTKAYEPSPRWAHCATPVGGRCFLWGGRVPDFSASGRKKLASTVEIFDPYLEVWEQQSTSEVPSPGLYDGTSVSLSDQLYSFGGYDGASYYNTFHTLDPTSLKWKDLRVLKQADGPMRKRACGMVPYGQDQLALFGGYGIPTGPAQPGATFVKNTSYTSGSGWSNELHLFNIDEGKWSIPTTTGPRPPPCSDFSFTAISDHLAVLFGGNQPGHSGGKVNDCYVMNFETMEWTKLERQEGAPWPAERSGHAACCLNYGQDHPQVLVTGGVGKNDNTLSDMWILDVKSGRWRELTLPEGAQPRMRHTVTAFGLGPGRTQVTMFGGCLKWEWGKSCDALPKLAETTVLEFESVETPSSGGDPPTQEWVLVGVAGSRQLGSVKRMRDMINTQRQALQEARSQQALDRRVQDAEARVRDLQIQFGATQDAYQSSQAENRALQTQLQASQDAYQQSQQSLQGEKKDLQLQLEALHDAYHESQQSLQTTQAEKQSLDAQLEALQRRVQDAEHRAEEAERRARDAWEGASEGEPSWVVQRDEINLTDTELGRGAWGAVRVAKFRRLQLAAKCLHTEIISDYNRRLFIREIGMAARVRHPNLLQFIGATLQGELIILTELMPTSVRRELANRRTFSHCQINSISLDVARALNYLHLMQPSPIIHRDISSANVLLEPGPNNSWSAKVSDYGSVNLLERLSTGAPGNPMYAAPEAQNAALQSPKMDIFSFGVLLVEMCTAQFPDLADGEHLITSIQQPNLVALIQRCLAEDSNARPSAGDIVTELSKQHND